MSFRHCWPFAVGLILFTTTAASADSIGYFVSPTGSLNEGQDFRSVLVDSPFTDSVYTVDPPGILSGSFSASVDFGGTGIYTYSWSGTHNAGDNFGSVTGTMSGSDYYYTDGVYTWSLSGSISTTTGTYNFSDTTSVTVHNVAPTITTMQLNGSSGSITIDEGTVVNAYMQATDPGYYDVVTFQVENTPSGTVSLGGYGYTTGTRTVSGSLGAFTQTGGPSTVYSLTGRVFDDDTNRTTGRSVTVNNLDPMLTTLPSDSISGIVDPFSFAASATDPGLDLLAYDWDLDGDGQYDDYSGPSGSAYFTIGVRTVGLRVADGDGGYAYGSFELVTIPEPSSVALFACGAIALLACRARRGSRQD